MTYTQGSLVDGSTTVEVDSRPINSAVVAAGSAPIWGGLAVQVFPAQPFGFTLQVAQDLTQLCAFTVFDRSTALLSTDEAPVPSAYQSMSINFVTLGCGERLVLAADPGVLMALQNASVATPLSYDFLAQRVIPYSSAAGQLPVRYVVKGIARARIVVLPAAGVAPGSSPAVGGTPTGPFWKTGAAVIVQL